MNKVDFFLNKIDSLQVKEKNKYFNAGMFPCVRTYKYLFYNRQDDNIFFPALVSFTFRKHWELFNERQKQIVQKINEGIHSNYPRYESNGAPYVYNFYQTKGKRLHFSNGYILNRFDQFNFADDADDTAMITMSKGESTPEQVKFIRDFLIKFSNHENKSIKRFDEKYAKLKFYGMWFGSGIMPIEVDVPVMCNVLYFIFSNKVTLVEQDYDTLKFISLAIESGDVENEPFKLTGIYPFPSVIIYHIARLCSIIPNASEYIPTDKLIEAAKRQLNKTENLVARSILASALLMLDQDAPKMNFDISEVQMRKHFYKFSFFIAPMLSGTEIPILYTLKKMDFSHIHYVSEAYYYSLLMENELLYSKRYGN